MKSNSSSPPRCFGVIISKLDSQLKCPNHRRNLKGRTTGAPLENRVVLIGSNGEKYIISPGSIGSIFVHKSGIGYGFSRKGTLFSRRGTKVPFFLVGTKVAARRFGTLEFLILRRVHAKRGRVPFFLAGNWGVILDTPSSEP